MQELRRYSVLIYCDNVLRNSLIQFLSLLLKNELPLDSRMKQLEAEYRHKMTKSSEWECVLGESIARRNHTEGHAEGLAEGEMTGSVKTLVALVPDNILTLKDAAKRLNMNEAAYCEKAGLQLPQ